MNKKQIFITILSCFGFSILTALFCWFVVPMNFNSNESNHSKEFINLQEITIENQKNYLKFLGKQDSLEQVRSFEKKQSDSLTSLLVKTGKEVDKIKGELKGIQREIITFKGRVSYSDSTKESQKDFYKNLKNK